MSETEVTMPSLGKPGEPCQECGSALDADQRYCLNCGARRGGPRVDDYRELVLGAPASPAQAPAGGAAEEKPEEPAAKAAPKTERDYAPLAAVGGIAVLGLMLLVGVLIGRGDGDGGSAPAPVVLEGGAGAASGRTASGEGGAGGEKGGSLTGGGSSGGGSEKGKESGNTETAAEAGAVEASTEDLEALENETGEDAAKNALKLPDKIATPGAPPPEDNKAPAGGEEGISIE